jgi:biotin transport system substrate-specific component
MGNAIQHGEVGTTQRPRARLPLMWPLTLLSGAALVTLGAHLALPVPFSPVPMTLQDVAVLLVGGLFGSAIGAGALLLYLLAGAFGLPVFAPVGPPGLARLLGPTGGYLLAFPVAAAVVGAVGQRGHLVRCVTAALLGMVLIHFGGWAQLAIQTADPARAVTVGLVPFLLPGLVKVVLVGAILWRAHHGLRLRS